MRVALVNPPWSYRHSIYFGCREPHLPLELGYARALLQARGHAAQIFDGQLQDRDAAALAERVADFGPDMTVVTTAPTYLFWRCGPPELRVPKEFLIALAGRGGRSVAVGPHASATPEATRQKLGVDLVVRGECEEAIAALADGAPIRNDALAVDFAKLPALFWPDEFIAHHRHHHHRFDAEPDGPGAEVEASRGCPYACTFCAKLDYRDRYRRREPVILLEEIDALLAQGVRYLYFIDEIFLPQRSLLEALARREVVFGVQTRIDLWKPEMLALLGRAGCVSIEAGVESLSQSGRASLDKNCRMSTDELAERLIYARRHVPFVQANLIATAGDDVEQIAEWRRRLQRAGVWANDPVPLYPYPSSPEYRRRWGAPDDLAWERAHQHYLAEFARFSDIQEDAPLPLPELEGETCGHR